MLSDMVGLGKLLSSWRDNDNYQLIGNATEISEKDFGFRRTNCDPLSINFLFYF